MGLLSPGELFPAIDLPRVAGGTLSLPGDLAGSFGVVLLYRGAWCPYCQAQLAGFARASEALGDAGILVAALSADDEEAGAGLVARRRLTFPVGHGADPGTVSEVTGAFTDDEGRYLQSTGFVLAPDGTVVTSVYSSGAIGRLVADDVVGLVRHLTSGP